jgi:hypothetical protein
MDTDMHIDTFRDDNLENSPYRMEYISYINEIQLKILDDPHRYIEGLMERSESKSEEMMNKCHPTRKMYADIIPFNLEIGQIEEIKFAAKVSDLISKKNICLDALLSYLIREFPRFNEFCFKMTGLQACENLASLLPILFPHRYVANGQRYFEMTPNLVTLLDQSDVGNKTPCHFMRTPYNTIFVEYKTDADIFNQVSGMHQLEGFYLNEFIIPECNLKEEYRETQEEGTGLMMLAHHINNKEITLDGGDVRLFEIMMTGSPLGKKDGIFDDATFSFSIMLQNNDLTVADIIKSHLAYYLVLNSESTFHTEGSNYKYMSEHQVNSFPLYINVVAKTLLYLNSSKVERVELKERDEINLQINRTSNKAKKRKLMAKLKKVTNKIQIGSNIAASEQYTDKGRTVKTHWRRGFLKHQKHGKKLSLTKLIFIEPTLVNSDTASSSSLKKSYEVR